jgi:hypothetical protein
VRRDEQGDVGIRRTVTMSIIGAVADAIPALVGWLAGPASRPPGRPSCGTTPST